MKKFSALCLILMLMLCMLCSCNAQKEVEQPNSSDESVADTQGSNESNLPTDEAAEPKTEYEWKDEYTIVELVTAINESSLDPLEERPGLNEDGSIDPTTPGTPDPVEYLRRADESLCTKILTLSLAGKWEVSFEGGASGETVTSTYGTIVVFYERTEARAERTVVITPDVMLVLQSNYGSAENFVANTASSASFKVLSSKIIGSDYHYCLQPYDIFEAGKWAFIEENPELADLELDFESDAYYAFYTENGFEYFSDNMWNKIYGEEEPVSDMFERTYERFGVKELIFG